MSFDQGAWDAITRLQNEQRRKTTLDTGYADVTDVRIAALEKRIAELEQRFIKFKKAAWRA